MIPLVTSAVIPAAFAHGFTTRAGGVSGGPYESLNLGMKWGDARENVVENRRRLMDAVGARTLALARQVHGANVVRAGTEEEADGICTDIPGEAAAVFVADCVPMLFADPRTGACAAVHAGWRGATAGIAAVAVDALVREFGSRPADLCVALGPSIGACCFEVGPEVAAQFPGAVIERRKPHVDLRWALRQMLERRGVTAIDASDACTRCDPASRFFSYRRDASRTGQQMGVICRRVATGP